MSDLTITRGLPGCGKTTFARAWVAGDREHRARVNRDDIRGMLDHGEFVKGVTEGRVLAARDALILGMLTSGLDVICDDTNLPSRTVRDLARLAKRARAGFTVIDMTDVPWQECVTRNAARTDKPPVARHVILDMQAQYLDGKPTPLPLPDEQDTTGEPSAVYEPKPGTPITVLCDIDGTVALKGTRNRFDESRVHEDRPNGPVINVLAAMHAGGHGVVFMSGRTDACREATLVWLREHIPVPFDALHMRAAGDGRKDSVVKRELFDRHIRERYDVRAVLDDRDQVVSMWRNELGLPCFQVADGDF